jgi:hypothetical protein
MSGCEPVWAAFGRALETVVQLPRGLDLTRCGPCGVDLPSRKDDIGQNQRS